MLNTWYTDYEIGGKKYWKCGRCQSLIPYSDNNMYFCGHCGEPKQYTTTEHKEAEMRRALTQIRGRLEAQGDLFQPI